MIVRQIDRIPDGKPNSRMDDYHFLPHVNMSFLLSNTSKAPANKNHLSMTMERDSSDDESNISVESTLSSNSNQITSRVAEAMKLENIVASVTSSQEKMRSRMERRKLKEE